MRLIVVSIDGLAGFYWNDPRARMPTLRALAARGALATTMETAFPSTTWPGHVSLVTGVRPARHGVVANSILNRSAARVEDLTGDPVYDAAEILRVPTIYDVARSAGMRTAAIDWPATRRSPSLDFNLPFFKNQQVFETQTAPDVWREVRALGHPVERMGEWAELPRRFLKDAMVADLAADVFGRHAPDLMLVHFLCTDSFQHLHGPRSPEAYWAIEYVDERIARLLATVRDVPERVALVVVSDHGFLPVSREVRVNVRLRKLGLLDVADDAITGARARFVMNHGSGYVYVLDERDREKIVTDLASELEHVEGVAHVWRSDAFASLGLPSPQANALVGDFLVEAEPGHVFVDDAAGGEEVGATRRYRGTHGQLPSRGDNAAFFLAAGPGIRRGVELAPIASIDVAPTIAALLGLTMRSVDGRVLGEILA